MSAGMVFTVPMSLPSGSAAFPSLSFNNERTLGFFRESAGVIGLAGALNVSGVFTPTGVIKLPNGTAAAPSLTFASATDLGLYRSSNDLVISTGGSARHQFGNGVYYLLSDTGTIRWGASSDVILTRDAAAVLALKNGANAQEFRVYGTTTGSKYLSLSHSGTYGQISSAGKLYLYPSTAVQITGATNLLWDTDNVGDIGAAGANRPRSLYVGTNGTFGGTIYAADGAAATPSVAFTNFTTTGMYAYTNNLAFSVNGVLKLRLDVNGQLNMYNSQIWTSDGLADIGTSTNYRPNNVYVRTGLFSGGTLNISGANGQKTTQGQATVQSGAMSGATLTLSNLIPAGSLVLGVTVHPTTTITSGDGGTTYSVGDGTDVDKFGAAIAFAADVTLANSTTSSPTYYTTATNIVLTCSGGKTFNAGVVRATVHYITLVAATS